MSHLLVQKLLREVLSSSWEDILTLVLRDLCPKNIPEEGIHLHKGLEITVAYDFAADGESVAIERIILKKPGVIHRAIAWSPTVKHSINIGVEQSHVCVDLGSDNGWFVRDTPALSLQAWGYDLETAMEFLKKFLGDSPPEPDNVKYLILFLKGLLAALSCSLTLVERSGGQHTLSPPEIAANYIRKYYYRQDLTVAEIAAFIGLTPNYFVNLFKEEFKTTVRQYLVLTRLEAGKALLETREYLVRDVARLTGWGNQYYFSTCFKKHFKYAPTAVKKR